MKADFQNKFDPNSLAQAKIHNKIVYVEGMTATEIKSQLKKAAKAAVKVEQAHKTQGFVTKVIGPIVNGLYTGRISCRKAFTTRARCFS